MSKIITRLQSKGLVNPPKWLPNNIAYLCQMGSVAYGVSNDNSDIDVYGYGIPMKEMLFKPLNMCIPGFDKLENFEQWTEHGIKDKDSGKEYDFSVYNITKYFSLVMQNNPNMLDSLFVPRRCVLHSSPIGEYVRDNRHEFIHKGCYHKFSGYAYSQLHKMRIKIPKEDSKRYEDYQKHRYSTKFAYHLVRLLNECEQILTEGTLDLERSREQLKSIRRGEWKMSEIEEYFTDGEKRLKDLYAKSTLQHSPDRTKIRKILFRCLEMHYDLSATVVRDTVTMDKLDRIQQILLEK